MNPILKDLQELYKTQNELDDRIIKEKNLQEERLTSEKILALYVEVGELANELPREFKFWSNKKNNYEKALIEYVDCLHFILSIGLDMGYTSNATTTRISRTTTAQINELFYDISILYESIEDDWEEAKIRGNYEDIISGFLGLGETLGFAWKQVVEAYYKKNKINHKRQEEGY